MAYRVLGRLSGGGFSELFEVEDPESALSERLVLKRLSAAMSRLPQVRAAFAEEARILRQLKHPNVVTFRRCYFDEEQRVCLLMEKVDGQPLDAWAGGNAGQPDAVLDLLAQVLAAVDYLHRRGSPFLHLDLKPDNILVTQAADGPQPVLIDFGIARRSGAPGLKAYTPPYGAPEQQDGRGLSCATDVHALGQILDETLAALVAAGYPPRYAEELTAVAAKARSPRPADRHPDAGAMALAFRRARLGPAVRRRHWRPVPAVAAVSVAALLGAWLASSWMADGLRERPAAPPATGPAADDAVAAEFHRLLMQADEALVDGDIERAEASCEQAGKAAAAAAPDSPAAISMSSQLHELKNQIDLMLVGGPAAEAVRVDLQDSLLKAKEGKPQ